MPDITWNTPTGPPGPTLLYEPPFLAVTATNLFDWTGGSGDVGFTLTWGTPVYGGIPFATVAGDTITFLCDCTIILTVELSYDVSAESEAEMALFVYGTAWDASFYWQHTVYGLLGMVMPVGSAGYMNPVFTTPPFRVAAGSNLLGYYQGNLGGDDTGPRTIDVIDHGARYLITRVS